MLTSPCLPEPKAGHSGDFTRKGMGPWENLVPIPKVGMSPLSRTGSWLQATGGAQSEIYCGTPTPRTERPNE